MATLQREDETDHADGVDRRGNNGNGDRAGVRAAGACG